MPTVQPHHSRAPTWGQMAGRTRPRSGLRTPCPIFDAYFGPWVRLRIQMECASASRPSTKNLPSAGMSHQDRFFFCCPLNIRSTWTALGPGGPRGVPQRSPGGHSGIPERSQRGPGEVPDGSRSGPRGMFEPNSFGTATGSPVGVSSLASLGLFGCPFGPLCGPLELPGSTLWAVLGPCWGCVRPSWGRLGVILGCLGATLGSFEDPMASPRRLVKIIEQP